MLGGYKDLPTASKQRNLVCVGEFPGNVSNLGLNSPDAVEPSFLIDRVDQNDLLALCLHSMACKRHYEQELLVRVFSYTSDDVNTTTFDLLPGWVNEEVDFLRSSVSDTIRGKSSTNLVDVLLASL